MQRRPRKALTQPRYPVGPRGATGRLLAPLGFSAVLGLGLLGGLACDGVTLPEPPEVGDDDAGDDDTDWWAGGEQDDYTGDDDTGDDDSASDDDSAGTLG